MNKPLLHSKWLKAAADGHELEFQNTSTDEHNHGWVDYPFNSESLYDFNCQNFEFRIKPKTININGYKVPEPVREKLEGGQQHWCAYMCSGEIRRTWVGTETDFNYLKLGIVHLTQEAAAIHVKALRSFTISQEVATND